MPIERELMSTAPFHDPTPRMPGAARFRHQLRDAAVLIDEVVGGDFGLAILEPLERLLGRLHSGVVQQQDVDARLARVVVRRRHVFLGDR